jgi:hypothetical protein
MELIRKQLKWAHLQALIPEHPFYIILSTMCVLKVVSSLQFPDYNLQRPAFLVSLCMLHVSEQLPFISSPSNLVKSITIKFLVIPFSQFLYYDSQCVI